MTKADEPAIKIDTHARAGQSAVCQLEATGRSTLSKKVTQKMLHCHDYKKC